MRKDVAFACLLLAAFACLPLVSIDRGPSYSHSEVIHADPGTKLKTLSAAATSLPSSWCGTEVTSDQTVNAADDSSPKFKFVYVRAADGANNFAAAANQIQRGIALMRDFIYRSTGGAKTIAVDLGTDCGADYADIQSYTLAHNASYYEDGSGDPDIDAYIDELQTIYAKPTPTRHYVFFADQTFPTGSSMGIGLTMLDDSPGASNRNNKSGSPAIIFGPKGSYTQGLYNKMPGLFLHEMTHTMGGVQESAPRATSAGHCTDGNDVMCYDDGSPEAAGYSTGRCAATADEGFYKPYDCGLDDYFNPAPASGSYLATHWNVFNSAYLVPCASAEVCKPGAATPTGPAQDPRGASNKVYLYKKGKRRKSIGKVDIVAASEAGTKYVNLKVTPSAMKMPSGRWKVWVCMLEKGEKDACKTVVKRSKRGKLKLPSITLDSIKNQTTAVGSITIKPASGATRRAKLSAKTKTSKRVSLDFSW